MENSNQEILFKRRQIPFTQASNTLIDDDTLSVQARFLYILIARWIDAPNFKIYKNSLQKHMKIKSVDTFDKYWKELKKAGYLIQYKFRADKGRWVYQYELLDIPVKPVEPKVEEDKEPTPTTPPKNQGVEEPGGGKLGGYNNTNLHNTNLHYTDKEISKDSNNKYNSVYDKILSCSDLSEEESNNNSVVEANDPVEKEIKNAEIPREYIKAFDDVATMKFKRDRRFYGINFDNGDFYMAFSDAITETELLPDYREIITKDQYKYFSKTLFNMLNDMKQIGISKIG